MPTNHAQDINTFYFKTILELPWNTVDPWILGAWTAWVHCGFFFLIVNTTELHDLQLVECSEEPQMKGLTKLHTRLLTVQRLGTPDPCVVQESALQPLKLCKCSVAAQTGNLILVSFSSKLLNRSSKDEKMKEMQLLFTEYLSCARHCARLSTDFPHLSYTKALSYLHSCLRAENKQIS